MSAKAETFGEYLKDLRLAKKASQGKLAAAIGKTTMYISNIEKGKKNGGRSQNRTGDTGIFSPLLYRLS